jgi:hypothetical protein
MVSSSNLKERLKLLLQYLVCGWDSRRGIGYVKKSKINIFILAAAFLLIAAVWDSLLSKRVSDYKKTWSHAGDRCVDFQRGADGVYVGDACGFHYMQGEVTGENEKLRRFKFWSTGTSRGARRDNH